MIRFRTPEEMGKPLDPKPAADPKAQAEHERKERLRRLMKAPHGRVKYRMRRGRLIKKVRRVKQRRYGMHFQHESGHAEAGHATFYYHATKGWRRRHTASKEMMRQCTLPFWVMWRGELIGALAEVERLETDLTPLRPRQEKKRVERIAELRAEIVEIKQRFKRSLSL